MIILLNGHSLTARDQFQAEAMGLQLSERQSSATLTVSDAAPVISVGDWMKSDSGPGAGIVWRVKTIDEAVEKKTRTITLEHAINTLRDTIMFGDIKPTTISGSRADPTARQAVSYILGKQSDWTLGDFAYSVSNPYSFNGDDLFSALETVSSSLQDCIWEYDFSRYPFRIHIRQMNSTLGSEMRTDRNIRTLRKTIDRSRMYTRLYPVGKDNLHIDGDYVSRNENIYGTVSKVETDQSITTKAELLRWANERISRHCEPAVNVTISGLELAEVTGEALDSFTIGRMCRVPLPEFSTQITERVTKLSYSDVISDPMSVTVTLANELQDVAKILREQAASGGRSSRTNAKNGEEDHAWLADNTEHIGLVAEAVAGPGADKDWSRVASIFADGTGLHGRVTYAEGELVVQGTAIEATQEEVRIEANERVTADKEMDQRFSGQIQVQSRKVAMVVKETVDGYVIKASEIVTAINDEGSYVGISADHVFITGHVQLSGQLDVTDGALRVKTALMVSGSTNGPVSINNGTISGKTHQVSSGGSVKWIGSGTGEYYDITTDILKGMIKSVSVSDNVLTLVPFYGDPINFNKAASAVSLTGSWSGRTFTVRDTGGSQQSYSETPTYETGTGYSQYDSITVDSYDSSHMAHARVKSSSAQGGNVLFGFKVDASGQYSSGQTNGRNGVNIVRGNWSDGRITFEKSAGTADTKAVKVGVTTGWQNGVFSYAVKDYEYNSSGESTGYSGQTDLGNPSMAKPTIKDSSASTTGRKQAGTGNLSKSQITVNGYLFFDVTVRGQVLKFYCPVGQ